MPIIEMYVHMDCAGCEEKIRKTLQKLEGDSHGVGYTKEGSQGSEEDRKESISPYNPEINNFDPRNYYSNNNHYENNDNYYFHQPNGIHHSYELPQIPPSYPYYYKQGYTSYDDYGYFHHSAPSTMVDYQASSIFSDENPHACSIM